VKQKTGILGGTFDPVHFSHLELAEAAQSEFDLDRVLFVPAAVPPHKIETEVTSFEHRVRMVEIACELHRTFECCSIEGKMSKPSYTVDTLKAMLADMGQENTLYFIIGSDAFLDVLTWKSYREILCLVSLLVSRRRGVDETKLSELAAVLSYNSSNRSVWSGKRGTKDIYFLKQTPAYLSSTLVKKYIGDEEMMKEIIPEKVAAYISHNKLYSLRL